LEEEIEEEEEEGEGDEGQENPREDEKGESGAETSESEAVMVSPRHSRAKSVTDVRMYCFVFVFFVFLTQIIQRYIEDISWRRNNDLRGSAAIE